MSFHKDFKHSTQTSGHDNPSDLNPQERKTENSNPNQAPEEVKTALLNPNNKLLTDEEIETLEQQAPKQGDYFHRKKIELLTPDRIDSDFPVAVGKHGALYAVYRDPQLDEPVVLGKGSFGKVKLAQAHRDPAVDWVATKIIKVDDEKNEEKCRKSVINEINILQKMGQTPADVLIERMSRKDGLRKFQFFMNIAKGKNLHSLVKEQKLPNDPNKLLKISLNFLQEIMRLHRLGYLHRDIKTGNIFVDITTEKVTLIDFGLGVKMDQQGQVHGSWCGTTTIMAPEILNKSKAGEICTYSAATDIYSAGIVLFAILFGKDRTCQERCYGDDTSFFKVGWEDHKKCLVSKNKKSIEIYDYNDTHQYTLEKKVWTLLEKMTDARPEKRPTLSKVWKIFADHLSMLEKTGPGCRCM